MNKALPVSRQSFASLVYKIKDIETERYCQISPNRSRFREKNVGEKCLGGVSIDHY